MKTDPNDSAYPCQTDDEWYLGLTKRERFSLEFAKVRLASNIAKLFRSVKMEDAVSDADALIAALNEEASK